VSLPERRWSGFLWRARNTRFSMQLTIEVPDHIAEGIGERAKLERDMLEAFAAEAYRTEKLSRRQVGDLLGLDYWDTEEFLSRHEAKRPYTLADLEVNRISLNDAPGK
jgi:hypothetical protein